MVIFGDMDKVGMGIDNRINKDVLWNFQNVGAAGGSYFSLLFSFSAVVLISATFMVLVGFTMTGPISPAMGRHFHM